MHIAIFLPGLYGGGAERVMLNLAAGLSRRGFHIDLLLAESVGPYLSEVPAAVRLVVLNGRYRRRLRTVSIFPALVRYIQKNNPAVLVSAVHANIIALWACKFIRTTQRIVVSEHNTFSQQISQYPLVLKWLVKTMTRRLYPRASGIVAVSNGVADDLSSAVRIDRASISVIYNPVVTPEFRTKTCQSLDHPWFRDGAAPVILAIGRLTTQKDFGTLIRAFAKVRSRKHVRLMILGEGEERPYLEMMLKNEKLQEDISMPGFVPNPYPFLAKASLFVLSSKWEGLPTVMVEALYCGVPIVSTDCRSGPREILKNGQYGRLVPVGDVTAMARAIEDMLMCPKCRAAEDESWKPYEYETVVDQYVSLLSGL